MISKMYYNDIKKALKASFKNGIACYEDSFKNTKLWINRGFIVHFEYQKNKTFGKSIKCLMRRVLSGSIKFFGFYVFTWS